MGRGGLENEEIAEDKNKADMDNKVFPKHKRTGYLAKQILHEIRIFSDIVTRCHNFLIFIHENSLKVKAIDAYNKP